MLRSLVMRLIQPSDVPTSNCFLDSDGYHVERLESRMMLAGQVSVSVSGNNLSIVGDNADNFIQVDTSSGFVRVLALDNEVLVGDINPNTGLTTAAAADLNNLTIRLKGGDDRLLGGPVPAPPESLTASPLESSAGNTLDVGGNFKLLAGGGNDDMTIFFVNVSGKATMNLGGGDDEMNVIGTEVDGNLRVISGGGDDRVTADASTANANVIFRGGGGEDSLELGVFAEFTLGGDRVNVKMGGGNDTLVVVDTAVNPEASILFHGNGGTDSRNDFAAGTATIKSFEQIIV